MNFHVYVLYSSGFDQIYTGYTCNVESRFNSHNKLATKGWTIRYRPWVLIHQEHFETKAEAMKRERELKSAQGRTWIRKNLLHQ